MGRVKPRSMTHSVRGWLRSGGAILIALLIAGCAAAGERSAEASPTAEGAASHAEMTAAQLLAATLAPLQGAAQFQTTVTIDGTVGISSEGRSVGGATHLTVTTAGASIEYIQIPPQAWARQTGGSWILVGADESLSNPLLVLTAPLTLDGPFSRAPDTLRATYPAAAFGLEGDAITIEITLAGSSATFTYETESAGRPTVSTTTIGPTTQLDPIVAPLP
jgi:hypothetical protein